MKRRSALALVLSLLLALSPVSVLAADGDFLLRRGSDAFESGRIYAVAAHEGRVYALCNSGLFAISPDGTAAQMEMRMEGDYGSLMLDPRTLLSVNGALCAVFSMCAYGENGERSFESGMLMSVSFGEDGGADLSPLVELDWSGMTTDMGGTQESLDLQCAFANDGKLYALGGLYGRVQNMVVFDLSDGGYSISSAAGLTAIAPYRDGLALAVKETGELGTIDLDTLRYNRLCDFPADACGLYYDAEADGVYFLSEGELRAMNGVDPESARTLTAMPIGYGAISLPAVTDGCYAMCDDTLLASRPMRESEGEIRSLSVQRMRGMPFTEDAHFAFLDAHPGVEVKTVEMSADLLAEMLSRSDSTDIYVTSTDSYEYEALFNRGYMAELTESETLTGLVSQMYPTLRDRLTKDGELYAFPIMLQNTFLFAYNKNALEPLGLTEEDMPRTWVELFDFLTRVPELMADHTDITLFEGYNDADRLRERLLMNMLSAYILYIAQPGREIAMDTPELRDMIEAFERVDFTKLRRWIKSSGTHSDTYPEGKVLFSASFGLTAAHPEYAFFRGKTPSHLRITDDAEPLIDAYMYVSFVNPYSKNRSLAIEYLETLAEHEEPIFWVNAMPERNEPIVSESAVAEIAQQREYLEWMSEQIEETEDPALRRDLEEMRKEYQKHLDEFVESNTFVASAESIAWYRESARYMTASVYIGLSIRSVEFYTFINQYLDGLIDAEEMIRSMDGRVRMASSEGF